MKNILSSLQGWRDLSSGMDARHYLHSYPTHHPCRGQFTPPGDKSISQRALLIAALTKGQSTLRGCLLADDPLHLIHTLRTFGVDIDISSGSVIVEGLGRYGFSAPTKDLYLGNSGTAFRLLAGVLVGQSFDSQMTGDASLSNRPMNRIIEPLKHMGAVIQSHEGKAPLTVFGNQTLVGFDYDLPIPSAQVKSCLLLAGLFSSSPMRVSEAQATRDHTERLLACYSDGAFSMERGTSADLTFTPKDLSIPGDFSSAAMMIVAALLHPDSEVWIQNVGFSERRTGLLRALEKMGADIWVQNHRMLGLEPVADIRVRGSHLSGIHLSPNDVLDMIDECPIWFMAAASAEGMSEIHGISELRVKESDRIQTMATGLRGLGILVEVGEDWVRIHGGRVEGGVVDSEGDHRVAMAFAVLGTVASGSILVKNAEGISSSFPDFVETCRELGLAIELHSKKESANEHHSSYHG